MARYAVDGGYVQQHVLHGKLAGGGAFRMPACLIVKVKDDLGNATAEARAAKLTEARAIAGELSRVEPDSPAAMAGIKTGDVLLGIDGTTIVGADDLVRALTGETIGRDVTLDVLRGTERLALKLTPQERKRAA